MSKGLFIAICGQSGGNDATVKAIYQKNAGSVKFQTFYRCHDLQYVTLPDNFTAIGKEAFFECSSMNKIGLPDRIQDINDNAFKNCFSLKEVNTEAHINNIGASAFYDCSSLTSFSRFSDTDNSKSFTTVGDHAFCKSGLTSANLALNLGYGDSWFGNYSFASCNNLQQVAFLKSTSMGNHMFEGCSSLTSFDVSRAININNYVGNYVFKDCSRLDHASFSKHQFSILEGFFEGCKSMRYLDFFDGYTYDEGDEAQFQYIKKFAFNGCSSLSSIQLPESIQEFRQLEDGCLSGCSSMEEIYLHGISADQLFPYYNVFPEGLWYGDSGRGVSFSFTMVNTRGVPEPVEEISFRRLDAITQIVKQKKCPLVFIWGTDYINLPNYETDWVPSVGYSADYWFHRMKAITIIMHDYYYGCNTRSDYDPYKQEMVNKRKAQYQTGNFKYDLLTYAIHLGLVRESALDEIPTKLRIHYAIGETTIGDYAASTQDQYDSAMTAVYNSLESRGWTQDSKTLCVGRTYMVEECSKSGFMRLCKDCTFKLKDNANGIRWIYDPSVVVPYVPKYEFESDRTTKSNFKTAKQIADLHPGQDVTEYSCWYYNAKEIFEEAQRTQKPLLLIYSMTTCTPCQMYGNNVHSDVEFQRWIAKQNILMCRLETPFVKTLDPEYSYCEDEIAKKQMLNYDAVDAESIRSYNAFQERQFGLFKGSYQKQEFTNPSFVFYWSKPDSNGQPTACHGYSLHDLSKIVKVQTIGYDGIKKLIKSLCLYHFEGNDASSSTFVHDAPAFNKIDYWTPAPENPYYIEDGLITLNGWSAIKGNLTPTAAHDAIKNILSKHNAESRNYPDYIGGCLWIDYQEPEQLEWIALTYDTSILESHDATIAQKIAELDKWKIIIGDKKYKLALSESDYKDLYDGCSTEKSRMYRYSFVETT